MRFSTATVAAVAAVLYSNVIVAKDSRTFAVLRFNGDPLVTARMDPVVSPGAAAAHLHTVMGGNAFAMSMPGTTAKDATCTNTKIKNDKSNYWTPSLFFHNGNGTFIPVPMFYMNVYYFFEATDDTITAFPDGFRMLSGDSSLRSAPTEHTSVVDTNAGTIQPVQFTCPRSSTSAPLYTTGATGTQDTNNAGAGQGFPDQNCDGYASPLRADIHFPSCYNPAAGPENYKENTQFPSSKGTTGGKANCPSGWIHTPHIFFEVYWNTLLFANEWTPGQGKQPFVLSNGDPTGYSLHGDFVNGWDTETLQTIIDTCDAGDSGMDKCPQIIGGLTDTDEKCTIESPIKETVTGTMDALPGCNPIQSGPDAAVKMTCAGGSAAVAASESSTPKSTTAVAAASSSASVAVDAAPSSTTAATLLGYQQGVVKSLTTMQTSTKTAATRAHKDTTIVSTIYTTHTHTKTSAYAAATGAKKRTHRKKHIHKKQKKNGHYARDILDAATF